MDTQLINSQSTDSVFTKDAVIWSKINSRGNLVEVCGTAESGQISLWVDGDRKCFCGTTKTLFNPTKSSKIYQFGSTLYAVTKAEKEIIDKLVDNVLRQSRQIRASWKAELELEIAEYPGLAEAIAKYGTYDRAHAAEDVFAAGLLMQWEGR